MSTFAQPHFCLSVSSSQTHNYICLFSPSSPQPSRQSLLGRRRRSCWKGRRISFVRFSRSARRDVRREGSSAVERPSRRRAAIAAGWPLPAPSAFLASGAESNGVSFVLASERVCFRWHRRRAAQAKHRPRRGKQLENPSLCFGKTYVQGKRVSTVDRLTKNEHPFREDAHILPRRFVLSFPGISSHNHNPEEGPCIYI